MAPSEAPGIIGLLKDQATSPAVWLFGLGLTGWLTVFWSRMTPAQGNWVLIGAVSLMGIGLFWKLGEQQPSLVVRLMWTGLGVCAMGLLTNYQVWIPVANTAAEKKSLLASVVEDDNYRTLVADVMQSLQPNAYISVDARPRTADGQRRVDIEMWPTDGSVKAPVIIDVIDRSDSKPVGIEAVDAAESKRTDLRVSEILLCSRTGFDAQAIRKAKRVKVGLISVLKEGDPRNGVIEEEVYLRQVSVKNISFHYEFGDPKDKLRADPLLSKNLRLTYKGKSVDGWLYGRMGMVVVANPKVSAQPLSARFDFKKPVLFEIGNESVLISAISIQFTPNVQWLAQTVQLDARSGIYNYVRGRVVLASGPNSLIMKNVNFDTATPISSAPPETDLGLGLLPGEVYMELLMMTDLPDAMPAIGDVADLESLVVESDLSPVIVNPQAVKTGDSSGPAK